MKQDIEKVLISKAEIDKMAEELGKKLSEDYKGKQPLMLCILKGSSIFMADLFRHVEIPCEMDFMCVSSYGAGVNTSGTVKIIKDLDTNIENRDVIIVEDIIDSGVTLSHLVKLLRARNPKSLEICTLLNKPSRRRVPVDIKYKGIDIPDEFVVGYGMDYAEKYRNLPDICILKPEIYKK